MPSTTKQKHSIPQSLRAGLQKFLNKKEEIDFKFSVIGGSYCLIHTNQRRFFCKNIKNKLVFLYSLKDLIKDYESDGTKGFKRFNATDSYIFLHLAIAYWRESGESEKCIQVLRKFIKANPNTRGRIAEKAIENNAWLFVLHIEGFSLLAQGYLALGMLEEASIVYSLYAKNNIADVKEKEAFLGYTYLLLGQYKKARVLFDENLKRCKQLGQKALEYLKYNYLWAFGLEKWEGNEKVHAREAFQNAKELVKTNSAEEKIMTYLINLIDTDKHAESMRSQFILLNKWRKEAGEKIGLPKESNEMQIILHEIRLLKKKIDLIEGKPYVQDIDEIERLKTEQQKYLVFIPYNNQIGTKILEASEKVIKKKYLPKSNEFDIFIYTESIFIKSKKEMVRMQLDARMRKLLIIFLRYKDKMIDPIPLYRKAWADSPERQLRTELDSDVTPYLKVAKSQLETKIYEYVPNFKVEKPRNQGYICKGIFNFCVIINSKDDKKYRLTEVSDIDDYS